MTVNPFQDLPMYNLPQDHIQEISGSKTNDYWIILSRGEAMNKDLTDYLKKILSAIGVDLTKNCFLFSLDLSEKIFIHRLLSEAKSQKKIISFGISPLHFGLSVIYQPQELFHLYTHAFLLCDEIQNIQNDGNKKRTLWESLQKLKDL